MKNPIISFLYNPIKVGAYCARVVVPFKAVLELWEFLSITAKQEHKRFKVRKLETEREYYRFLRDTGEQEFLAETLDDMLNFLIKLKICPKQITRWAEHGEIVIYPEYFVPEEEKEGFFFFPPQVYFADTKDAVSIKIDSKAEPDLVIEIASLTPKALAEFRAFIKAIPGLGSKIVFVDQGRRHSKRFIFDLYPAVAALWIDDLAHRSIRRDTSEYISNSIDYLDRRVWQMSIILSSIAVEVLLADIYEELSKKEAPPAPIGFLVQEIEKKKKFPPEAKRPLKTVNKMRISAAHRGVISFTEDDAILGLMDALKFILWFAFNSKDFCDIQTKK